MPSTKPHCYALHHGEFARECPSCPVRVTCKDASEFWRQQVSLSQAALKAREELDVSTDVPQEVNEATSEIYLRLLAKHYGRSDRWVRQSVCRPYAQKALAKAEAMCAAENIPVELWITANMVSCYPRVSKSKYGFQPNMLLGDKARGRYNAYIRKSNRMRRVSTDVFDTRTRAKLLDVLIADEVMIGARFIRNRVEGGEKEIRDIVSECEVSQEWKELQKDSKVARCVRLTAAATVAGSYNTAYPDCIGVRGADVSWEALAKCLTRLITKPERRPVPDADTVPGMFWR